MDLRCVLRFADHSRPPRCRAMHVRPSISTGFVAKEATEPGKIAEPTDNRTKDEELFLW